MREKRWYVPTFRCSHVPDRDYDFTLVKDMKFDGKTVVEVWVKENIMRTKYQPFDANWFSTRIYKELFCPKNIDKHIWDRNIANHIYQILLGADHE